MSKTCFWKMEKLRFQWYGATTVKIACYQQQFGLEHRLEIKVREFGNRIMAYFCKLRAFYIQTIILNNFFYKMMQCFDDYPLHGRIKNNRGSVRVRFKRTVLGLSVKYQGKKVRNRKFERNRLEAFSSCLALAYYAINSHNS